MSDLKAIDPEVLDQMDNYLEKYLSLDLEKSRQRFEATDAAVRKNLADLFARLPAAVKDAGLDQDASAYGQILLEMGKGGLSELEDATREKLFDYALRLREVLVSLGADSPEIFARAAGEPPGDRWHSAGLGAIVFWPYSMKVE